MKRTKRTLTLLLTAAMLTSCLLPLAGCKKTATDDPFNDAAPSQSEKGENGEKGEDTNPISSWESSGDSHGEKIMYGKLPSGLRSILRWNDMMIGTTSYNNLLGYFTIEEPDQAKLICFDPLCLHLPQQESCPAETNYYHDKEDTTEYPNGMYLDMYENAESPVIYFYYRRDDFITINIEEVGHRDPVYCIERYDLSKGKREVVLDNVENTIQQACNYEDYVYYVLDTGDEKGPELYRIHKSGGEPQKLDREEKAESIQIIDAIDDKVYYVIDERYIYRADLDLTESEMVLDMSTVKGQDGSNGVIQGSYSGYLYYIADVETVWAGTPEDSDSALKGNLYRIPTNDFTKTPEMMVKGMRVSDGYAFTEKTLYYEPCVQKTDNSVGGETAVNTCDGKLFALNLITGESKTIVEDSGMTIYPKYAWDDMVVFAGWAYETSGMKYSGGNSNLLIAYTSGEPFEVWCTKGAPGYLSREYLEALRGK